MLRAAYERKGLWEFWLIWGCINASLKNRGILKNKGCVKGANIWVFSTLEQCLSGLFPDAMILRFHYHTAPYRGGSAIPHHPNYNIYTQYNCNNNNNNNNSFSYARLWEGGGFHLLTAPLFVPLPRFLSYLAALESLICWLFDSSGHTSTPDNFIRRLYRSPSRTRERERERGHSSRWLITLLRCSDRGLLCQWFS